MVITERMIRDHIDAIARGDFDAVAEQIADDFVQDWPQSGERLRGKTACLAVFRNYPGGSPAMSVRRVSGSGDQWTVELDMSYPAAGRYFGVSILEFRDGKLVHEADYWGEPTPAPDWRRQWVEIVDEAAAPA